ncbi:hypothetical protein [Candidatus Protochlamydia phocaeensis]|uniref:hypothetical protein n=1 Tax=Candidatus Protochlamydia phocaeensis TaxID=1414722 RepID=UPI000838AA90|nr:hypothetical protein [Candidatus Protochlamydia phocaeensis]
MYPHSAFSFGSVPIHAFNTAQAATLANNPINPRGLAHSPLGPALRPSFSSSQNPSGPFIAKAQVLTDSKWNALMAEFVRHVEEGNTIGYYQLISFNPLCHSQIDKPFKLSQEAESPEFTMLSFALKRQKFDLVKILTNLGANPGQIRNGQPLYLTAFYQGDFASYFEACKDHFPLFTCINDLSKIAYEEPVHTLNAFWELARLQSSSIWNKEAQKQLCSHDSFHYYHLIESISWAFQAFSPQQSSQVLNYSPGFNERLIITPQIRQILLHLADPSNNPLPPLQESGSQKLNQTYHYPYSIAHTPLTKALMLGKFSLIPFLFSLGANLYTPYSLDKIHFAPSPYKLAFQKGFLRQLYQAYGIYRFPASLCAQELLQSCFPLSPFHQVLAKPVHEAIEQMRKDGLFAEDQIPHPNYPDFVRFYFSSAPAPELLKQMQALPPLAYTERDLFFHLNEIFKKDHLALLKKAYGYFAQQLDQQWTQAHLKSPKISHILLDNQGALAIDLAQLGEPLHLWDSLPLPMDYQKTLAHHFALFLKLRVSKAFECHPIVKEAIIPQSKRKSLELSIPDPSYQQALPLLQYFSPLFFQLKMKEWLFHIQGLEKSIQHVYLSSSIHPCFIIDASSSLKIYCLNIHIHPLSGLTKVSLNQDESIQRFLHTLDPLLDDSNNQANGNKERAMQALAQFISKSPACFALHAQQTYHFPEAKADASIPFHCVFWQQISSQTIGQLNLPFDSLSTPLKPPSLSAPIPQTLAPPAEMSSAEKKPTRPLPSFGVLPFPYSDPKKDCYQAAVEAGLYLSYHATYLDKLVQQVRSILDNHPEYRNFVRTRQWLFVKSDALTAEQKILTAAFKDFENRLLNFTSPKESEPNIEIYEYDHPQTPNHFIRTEKQENTGEATIYLLRKFTHQRRPYFDLLFRYVYDSQRRE